MFLIDAVDMGLNPGDIRFVPSNKIGLMHISTHGIPLSVLTKYLSQYIESIKIIGIQPKTMSGSLTPNVKRKALYLIDIIKNKQDTLIETLS